MVPNRATHHNYRNILNKVFLPALVNPTAPRTIGAAITAPVPATTATPAAFRARFPKKFTN